MDKRTSSAPNSPNFGNSGFSVSAPIEAGNEKQIGSDAGTRGGAKLLDALMRIGHALR